MGKFGPNKQHPSVNEDNTYTDDEMMSPEFRAEVDKLKKAIRIALSAAAPNKFNMAHFWSAMQETLLEVIEAYTGRDHAEKYNELVCSGFNKWQSAQPVSNSDTRKKDANERYN
jgi:hypothetical protein